MNYYNINHKDEIVSFKEATLRGLERKKVFLSLNIYLPYLLLSLKKSLKKAI